MAAVLFRNVQPYAHALPGTSGVQPPTWLALGAFLVLSATAAAGFLASMPYARKETTLGVVAPQAGTVRIAAPQPGTLAALFVADGAVVEAGAALFTVDYRRAMQDGGTLETSLRQALDGQQALLNEQIRGETIRAAHEQAGLESRIAGLQADRRALQEQRILIERRVRVAAERFDGVGDLRRRGLITEGDYRAREDALLARRQEMTELDQRAEALDHAQRQAGVQLAQVPADSADRTAKLRGAMQALEQQKVQAAAAGSEVVHAPVAGRVTALQAGVGQQIGPAKPLLVLVPQGAPMHAELFVPSRAIGFVQRGQAVRLMYDAFPFQRFGAYAGTIDNISETMLTPEEVVGPVRPTGPVYRVSVRLERGSIAAVDRDIPLQADLTLKADIVLERRTVLRWMLDPLLAVGRRVQS